MAFAGLFHVGRSVLSPEASLSFPALRGHLHPWICGLVFQQSQLCGIFFLLSGPLFLLSHTYLSHPLLPLSHCLPVTFRPYCCPLVRTPCDYLGAHLAIQLLFPSQGLKLITPAKSLLRCKVTLTGSRN